MIQIRPVPFTPVPHPAVADPDLENAVALLFDLFYLADVEHHRTVDADKLRTVQTFTDLLEGFPDQIVLFLAVDTDIIAFGHHPVYLLRSEEQVSAQGLDDDEIVFTVHFGSFLDSNPKGIHNQNTGFIPLRMQRKTLIFKNK